MRQEGRRPFGREGFGREGFRRERGFRGGPSGPSIDYRALVEFVARSVAEKPEAVDVQAFDRPRGALAIKVKMAEEDVGKLIGKRGRNIEALRTLVRTAALRERRRVFVDLA
jgi:predicted RNA-binding protein YlqC (UPF0109 family)